jgi:hypothetical protein
MISRVLVVGMLLWAAAPLGAQEVLVTPGARVRLMLKSTERVSGTFSAASRDSLLLEVRGPGGVEPSWFSLADIQRIERHMGKRHPWGTSILLGTAIGGGLGALVGATMSLCEPTGEGSFECLFQPTERGEAVGAGAALGGFTGAFVGIIVGAVGRDRWQPASLPALQPTVTAGSAGLQIRFRVPVRL